MSDLAEFLLARIDEDEKPVRHDVGHVLFGGGIAPWVTRQRAECRSKRRLVRYAQSVLVSTWDDGNPEQIVTDLLKLLALPYADHSDYRAEWER